MLKLNNPEVYKPLALAGGAGLLAVIIGAGAATEVLADPERAYGSTYTAAGDCLDNTPYDLADDAHALQSRADGERIFTVVPEAANSYRPSVLSFVYDTGFFSVDLSPVDTATKAFLAEQCGDTTGY